MSATVMQWSLTQQCGPSRGFCPECDNSFTIKSAGPYRCGTPNICMTRGGGCNNRLAPRGFIVELYQQGLANGITHGPFNTQESGIISENIPDCDFPGIPGPAPNLGCGWQADLDFGRYQPPGTANPNPYVLLGFVKTSSSLSQQTAKLLWFSDHEHSTQASMFFGANVDLSISDGYFQVLEFHYICGNAVPGPVFKAYPYR